MASPPHDVSIARAPVTLSPTRQQLLAWFRKRAAPLADAYEGAIYLLADRALPGRIHFIAHAVRDICDRLAYVLDPQLAGSRVQYENRLDAIEKDWPHIAPIVEKADVPSQSDGVAISYKVARLIDSLVEDHRSRRRTPSQYKLLFEYLMRNEPSKAALNERVVEDFKAMRRWFMDWAHFRSYGPLQVDEDDLQRQFSKFEKMLHSFVGDFFTGTAELDAILHQANQSRD